MRYEISISKGVNSQRKREEIFSTENCVSNFYQALLKMLKYSVVSSQCIFKIQFNLAIQFILRCKKNCIPLLYASLLQGSECPASNFEVNALLSVEASLKITSWVVDGIPVKVPARQFGRCTLCKNVKKSELLKKNQKIKKKICKK